MHIGLEAEKYTVAIYRIRRPMDPPEHFGSGILLKVNEKYFLVTCDHLLLPIIRDAKHGPPCLLLPNMPALQIIGRVVSNESLDVAITELNIDLVLKLKKHKKFFDIERQLWGFPDSWVVENELDYLIVGYPISRTEVDRHKRLIKSKAFMLKTKQIFNKNYFKSIKANIDTNFLAHYRKRKVIHPDGELKMGPNPVGLSGSAIWRIIEFDKDTIQFYPIGIISEYHGDINVLTGPRIQIIVRVINQKFQ